MSYAVYVEQYKSSHMKPLLQLLRSHFKEGDKLLSPEYSEWLYARNPFGTALMLFVESNSEWVACLSFVPVRLRRSGETLFGYYAVNALVHPEHQGKKLFARMIAAGMEHIAPENSVLIGHPNLQAMGTWRKTSVHFQEELAPFVVMPLMSLLPSDGLHARKISTAVELPDLSELFRSLGAARDHWKVDISNHYLRWRYFEHPCHDYKVQVLERGGHPVGFQVTRQVRPMLNLMIDQFTSDEDAGFATAKLPALTICFVGETASGEMGKSLLRLPIKKRMQFFFTRNPPVPALDVRHAALSASDF